MVAVSYNQQIRAAKLYIGGKSFTIAMSSSAFIGNIVAGGLTNGSPGFHGFIDNLFVYNDFMSDEELDFL